MWLHVGVFGPVEGLGPLDGECLHVVHDLAAAVVARARVALGVLVREHAPHSLQHRHRSEVLRRDELDIALLPTQLLSSTRFGDDRIDLLERQIGIARLAGNALQLSVAS